MEIGQGLRVLGASLVNQGKGRKGGASAEREPANTTRVISTYFKEKKEHTRRVLLLSTFMEGGSQRRLTFAA